MVLLPILPRVSMLPIEQMLPRMDKKIRGTDTAETSPINASVTGVSTYSLAPTLIPSGKRLRSIPAIMASPIATPILTVLDNGFFLGIKMI